MNRNQTITFKDAKDLRTNFKTPGELEKLAKKGDYTQEVFFDYDGLMDYLTKLPARLGAAYGATKELGIKLYFGIYPDPYPAYPAKSGKLTVMVVPTMKVGQQNIDQITKTKMLDNIADEILEAFNHGDLCPPYNGNDGHGNDICTGSAFD